MHTTIPTCTAPQSCRTRKQTKLVMSSDNPRLNYSRVRMSHGLKQTKAYIIESFNGNYKSVMLTV